MLANGGGGRGVVLHGANTIFFTNCCFSVSIISKDLFCFSYIEGAKNQNLYRELRNQVNDTELAFINLLRSP